MQQSTLENDTWNEDPDSIPQNLFNPPRKDTVLLPSGGYVIARLTTDNPGWWFLHCHIEHHLLGGMAILLNVKPNEQPSTPMEFPGCSDFDWNESDFFEKYQKQEPDLVNVATSGVAYLSAGENAIYGSDGDPRTCALLDPQDKSWWKVDLGQPFAVHRVILKRQPNRWRNDLRCGADYPLSDGSPAECDPSGIYPCCSPSGWCGNTDDHCTCSDCTDFSSTMKWRADLRCGPDYPAADGSPAQCNPNGEFPCCSPYAWCGKTADHCDCDDCADYRGGGLVGAVVRVGSEENIEIHHQCGEVLTPRILEMSITTVDCITPIVGRYVSLQSDRGNPVVVCEVSVMAPESGAEQPTFDSGCGLPHDLAGETGTITSLDYDGTTLYENDARCEFRIRSTEGKEVVLDFEALDLEGGFDYIWVIGPQLQKINKFTGQVPPEPLETGYSEIIVRFTSDNGGQATGFKINWSTK
ncbi:uncharacterized protein [Ptychodera flava]|uniref:uncharacterized protein isoform X2 n=1 Tax=Ptychodera flava TaxID=63121 RepID=UPI00396A4BE9